MVVLLLLYSCYLLYLVCELDCCYLSFPYNFTRYRKVKGEHLEGWSRVGGTE